MALFSLFYKENQCLNPLPTPRA